MNQFNCTSFMKTNIDIEVFGNKLAIIQKLINSAHILDKLKILRNVSLIYHLIYYTIGIIQLKI